MLDRLMRRTAQWKALIAVLLAFSVWLFILAWSRASISLLLAVVLLEAFIVCMLSLKMLQRAQQALAGWNRRIDEALDPQGLQDALAKEPALAETLEGRNLLSLAARLAGRPMEGCDQNAQALQLHPRAPQQVILYYNRAWLLLEAGRTKEGEASLQQAKRIWNDLPARTRSRISVPFAHLEWELADRKGTGTADAYIACLEDALLSEPMTLCSRMLIRKRLAVLYHARGDDQRAYEQLAWLDRFASRTALPKQARAILEGEATR